MDSLPWHPEIRATWSDHTHLRIDVALPFFWTQVLGQRQVQSRSLADSFGPAEVRQDRAFVLVDGVKTAQQTIAAEKAEDACDHTDNNFHRRVL